MTFSRQVNHHLLQCFPCAVKYEVRDKDLSTFLSPFVPAFPKENPNITVLKMKYEIGDEIDLNCTSGKSHPASILSWYIHEKQVSDFIFFLWVSQDIFITSNTAIPTKIPSHDTLFISKSGFVYKIWCEEINVPPLSKQAKCNKK